MTAFNAPTTYLVYDPRKPVIEQPDSATPAVSLEPLATAASSQPLNASLVSQVSKLELKPGDSIVFKLETPLPDRVVRDARKQIYAALSPLGLKPLIFFLGPDDAVETLPESQMRILYVFLKERFEPAMPADVTVDDARAILGLDPLPHGVGDCVLRPDFARRCVDAVREAKKSAEQLVVKTLDAAAAQWREAEIAARLQAKTAEIEPVYRTAAPGWAVTPPDWCRDVWELDVRKPPPPQVPYPHRMRVLLNGEVANGVVAATSGLDGAVLKHRFDATKRTTPDGKTAVNTIVQHHPRPCACPPHLDRNRWESGRDDAICMPLEVLRGHVQFEAIPSTPAQSKLDALIRPVCSPPTPSTPSEP